MIRAVLFDLGNTLVDYYQAEDFGPILEEAISLVCEFESRRRGHHICTADVIQRAYSLNVEAPSHRVRLLEDRLSRLFGEVPAADLQEMSRIFLGPIFGSARLQPQALETIRGLRAMGLKTGIVSNTPWGSPSSLWRAELKRHGLLDSVDTAVFCVDVGWRKPAAPVFRRALEALSVSPDEALFVGDDARWDIEGAEGCGIRPVLFSPTAEETRPSCTAITRLDEIVELVGT